jgi:sensor domain CHASE-containing protein
MNMDVGMGRSDYGYRRSSSSSSNSYGSAPSSREASLPGKRWFRNSPLVFGVLVSGLLLIVSLGALHLQQKSAADARRTSLQQSVGVAALLLQADLMQAFSVADSLGLLVKTTGRVDNFDELARTLLQSQPLLSAIALAPDGRIQQVAPMDSQGSLIGRNMFDDPTASDELQEAIHQRAMVISRPQLLISGAVGVIARLPVFRTDGQGSRARGLWGFVLVQVKLPNVLKRLEDVGLTNTEGHYALATTDLDRGHRIAFYPFPPPQLANAEFGKILLPQRQWMLMVESPPQAASAGVELKLIAAAACAAIGLACALWQRHRLVRRARRNFYRESSDSLLSDIEIDGAHRLLDRVRHLPGWTLLLLVRMPVNAGVPGGSGIESALHGVLRSGDLLLPLGGSSFLVIAHSMGNQHLAMRVRDRLVAQMHGLSVGVQVLIHHRLLLQPEADIRQLFAEAVAEMHLDAAAERRRRAPPSGDLSLTDVQAGGEPETRDR